MKIQIFNKSNKDAKNIYFLMAGSKGGRHCYINIKNGNHEIVFLHHGINSEHYSYKLSDIGDEENGYVLPLIELDSGRLYV